MTSESIKHIVVVGAGLAGAHAAFALRERGFTGRLHLIGREPELPYDRPPLSKAYLKGEMPQERMWQRPATAYAQADIQLLLGTGVTGVDRFERHVMLEGGQGLYYDRLLLATGGEPRRLKMPGAELAGVCVLKTLADAQQLARLLLPQRTLAIIGGGYVGLEVAATAVHLGCRVIVLESQSRVLARSVSPVISEALQALHRSKGVDLRLQAQISHLEGDSRVRTLVMADGERIAVDAVLMGVGNLAADELARQAGLATAGGILVDRDGRTGDPHVFAAGDCAAVPQAGADAPLRLESVQNARAMVERAAAAMLGQTHQADEAPWFWSEQYDTRLQMAGLPLPGDQELVRGDPATGRFAVIHQNAQRMTAIACVNQGADFVAGKKMLALARTFPADLLCRPDVSLREIREGALSSLDR